MNPNCTNHYSDGTKIFPNRECCKPTTTNEHLDLIIKHIDRLLQLAEKRTHGRWECVDDANDHWGMVEVKGPRVRVIGFTQATDVSFEQGITIRADRDFIASAAGNFEAALRSMKLAILELQQADDECATVALLQICEQWPVETLTS